MSLKLIRKPKSQWTGQTVREKNNIQVVVFILNNSCMEILHLFCMECPFPSPYVWKVAICAQHLIFQAYVFQGYSNNSSRQIKRSEQGKQYVFHSWMFPTPDLNCICYQFLIYAVHLIYSYSFFKSSLKFKYELVKNENTEYLSVEEDQWSKYQIACTQ